jgi:pimeloyl-ACP methyl ester carboxylesterase
LLGLFAAHSTKNLREDKFMYRERQKYVANAVHQLNQKLFEHSYVSGRSLEIDFRTIQKISPLGNATPILLATGWGSGWEGIVPLAFSFACEGFMVILLSFPGYGDSENPPPEFYKRDLYCNYAVVAMKMLKMLGFSSAYFVGHSMGAEILAKAAAISPGSCEKLVLLNPSGIKPVIGLWQKTSLVWRFAFSGVRLRKEYYQSERSRDDYLKPLIDWCGKQKNPWRWGRLCQRRAEFREICRGQLPEILKGVECPVVFFSGDRDTVYPAYEGDRIIREAVDTINYDCEIVEGIHHNPTLFHSEPTAHIIAEHLVCR